MQTVQPVHISGGIVPCQNEAIPATMGTTSVTPAKAPTAVKYRSIARFCLFISTGNALFSGTVSYTAIIVSHALPLSVPLGMARIAKCYQVRLVQPKNRRPCSSYCRVMRLQVPPR